MIDRILRFLSRYMTLPVVLGALGFSFLMCAAAGWGLYWLPPIYPSDGTPTPALTVIPEFTATPYLPTATPTFVPTATENLPPSPLPGMIGVGTTVQIFGTDGEALNIRTSAGLGTQVRFLALESEIFEVQDGPVVVDDITWWFLVTPLDEGRNGWAASNYLSLVP